MIVTLSLAKLLDRRTSVSEVKPVQDGRMPRAAGAHAVRTIGRDTQYETGLDGLEYAAVDEFALDCVHSMRGTKEFSI